MLADRQIAFAWLRVYRLFDKWCAADATAFTAAENSTMNLEEWMMFLQTCKLIGPDGVTTRVARSMFVQVNLVSTPQYFAIRGACPTGQTHPQALCRASVVDWQLSDTLLLLRVVGQDDELYEQSDSDNDASELVYDEFAECVVRLADAIHGEGTKSNKVVKGKLVYAHKQSAVEVEG